MARAARSPVRNVGCIGHRPRLRSTHVLNDTVRASETKGIRRLVMLGAALLVQALPTTSLAASVETLVMPGKVIQGHAKYEAECSNFHARFSKSTQTPLYLECHKKVATDIAAVTGFHGRVHDIKEVECKSCHTDHKGRDADIVQLDRERFQHDATDFPLRSAHAKATCGSCHLPDKAYRDTPMQRMPQERRPAQG
jgi:hypothetical protein